MNLRQTIGTNVRKNRESKKWSQRVLAEKAYINQVTVSSLETGRSFSIDMLETVAEALDVEPHVLLLPIEEDES